LFGNTFLPVVARFFLATGQVEFADVLFFALIPKYCADSPEWPAELNPKWGGIKPLLLNHSNHPGYKWSND
jgi:hypothetical protein